MKYINILFAVVGAVAVVSAFSSTYWQSEDSASGPLEITKLPASGIESVDVPAMPGPAPPLPRSITTPGDQVAPSRPVARPGTQVRTRVAPGAGSQPSGTRTSRVTQPASRAGQPNVTTVGGGRRAGGASGRRFSPSPTRPSPLSSPSATARGGGRFRQSGSQGRSVASPQAQQGAKRGPDPRSMSQPPVRGSRSGPGGGRAPGGPPVQGSRR